MLLKIKLPRQYIRKRNLIITFVAVGLPLRAFSFSLTASVAPWLGILAYKDVISIKTNIVSLVSSCLSHFFEKIWSDAQLYFGGTNESKSAQQVKQVV